MILILLGKSRFPGVAKYDLERSFDVTNSARSLRSVAGAAKFENREFLEKRLFRLFVEGHSAWYTDQKSFFQRFFKAGKTTFSEV